MKKQNNDKVESGDIVKNKAQNRDEIKRMIFLPFKCVG